MVLSLLPTKVARLFPKSALDILSSIAARDPTHSFDPNGKSVNEIVTAVKCLHLSKVDAVLHLTNLIDGIADNEPDAATKIKKLEAAIKSIESVASSTSVSSVK